MSWVVLELASDDIEVEGQEVKQLLSSSENLTQARIMLEDHLNRTVRNLLFLVPPEDSLTFGTSGRCYNRYRLVAR